MIEVRYSVSIMENCSSTSVVTNLSNSSQDGLGILHHPVFTVLRLVMIISSIIFIVLCVLLSVVLFRVRELPRAMQLLLVNQLAAVILFTIANVLGYTLSAILVLTSQNGNCNSVWLTLCNLLFSLSIIGGVSRTWNLAIFSVTVLVILKYRATAKKEAYSVGAVVGVWVTALLINSPLFVLMLVQKGPPTQFIDGIQCAGTPIEQQTAADYIMLSYGILFFWSMFGTIIPLGISFSIPIAILCYLKRNTLIDDSMPKKAVSVAKFALFLLIGNFINLAGLIIPVCISVAVDAESSVVVSEIIIALSAAPTPIILTFYFKVVRAKLKLIIILFTSLQKNRRKLHLVRSNNISVTVAESFSSKDNQLIRSPLPDVLQEQPN